MDFLHHLFWYHDRFFGITWNTWKVVGFCGNAVFSARFLVQWHATEKRKKVVVPTLFWWLSLVGSLLLLIYAIVDKEPVFVVAYAFNWIPYIRNLVIHVRHERAQQACADCGMKSPPSANFCAECGARLAPALESLH